MARQEINLGAAPTGAGGDTTRSTAVKINAMTLELYQGIGTPAAPLPVSKGGNGGAAIVIGNGANCDTLVDASLYALNGTFTNGPPSFGSAAFFLRVSVHGVGYEAQEAFGITHGGRAERRRINSVWQPWANIYNGINATLDPTGTGAGLMSSALVGGYAVSKYANGEINVRGTAPLTASFAANELRVVMVTLPITLVNGAIGFAYKSSTNAQPQQTYDFYGVIAEYMSDTSTAAFVIRNGLTVQTFQPTINVWGRWK